MRDPGSEIRMAFPTFPTNAETVARSEAVDSMSKFIADGGIVGDFVAAPSALVDAVFDNIWQAAKKQTHGVTPRATVEYHPTLTAREKDLLNKALGA